MPDSSYRALTIGSLKELFCASPTYLNKNGGISSVEDLLQLRWKTTSWQNAAVKIGGEKAETQQTITLKEFAKTNTLPPAIGMTLRNLGITLIPDIFARPLLEAGDLVHIAKNLTGPEWPVYTVHAYQNDKSIHLTRFHQLVCRKFGKS